MLWTANSPELSIGGCQFIGFYDNLDDRRNPERPETELSRFSDAVGRTEPQVRERRAPLPAARRGGRGGPGERRWAVAGELSWYDVSPQPFDLCTGVSAALRCTSRDF